MDVSPVNKPNFFIVGAPRCGTTSMTQWLSTHPDVFFPDVKVPCHFGADLDLAPKRRYRDLKTYLELFSPSQDRRRIGESTPFYLFSETAAQEISAFARDARIIIMLRNPVDMMYSMHARNLKDGNETVRDFRRALDLEDARVAGRDIPKSAHFPQALHYRKLARYSEQLQRYLDHFPRDQIHIIVFEDLKRDPSQTAKGVMRFLEIDDQVSLELGTANASHGLRSPALVNFLKRPPLAFRILPGRARDAIAWRINRFNFRTTAPSPIDHHMRSSLLAEFRPMISTLGKMLDRDLSFWVDCSSKADS